MHPEDIKASLRKKGVTLASVAKELGVHYSVVSNVLRNRRSSRVEKRIAEVLNLPLHDLWPERYGKTRSAR